MTQNVLPQQRKLLSIEKDGSAIVRQGSLEVQCVEMEGATMGGLGAATERSTIVREMVRKERRTITDFYRMRQKMNDERIPEVKQEMRTNIIERFGTLRTDQLLLCLYAKMLADPRIQTKTRHGQTIKTTLSAQKEYAQERSALALERKVR